MATRSVAIFFLNRDGSRRRTDGRDDQSIGFETSGRGEKSWGKCEIAVAAAVVVEPPLLFSLTAPSSVPLSLSLSLSFLLVPPTTKTTLSKTVSLDAAGSELP